MRSRDFVNALAAITLALASAPVAAQTPAYPNGPVRLVVPFPAGAPASIVAHAIGTKLAIALGQPVVIDNRPGAGGNLGTDIVAKAAPNGQMLLLGTNGPLVNNVSLQKALPFDPLKDFAPISYVASIPIVLVAHPAVPANTVPELIRLAKATPGKLSYASSGIGTGGHLAGALLSSMAGVEMVHVPYLGAAPATTDVVGGHVPLMFNGLAIVLPHIRAGRVKALGVATARRVSGAPDIPTIAESAALPGYEITSWYGVLAPAGTPRPIIEQLHREIVRILDLPDVKEELFVKGGLERVGSTPDEFAAIIRREIPQYERIIKLSGAKAD